MSIVDRLISHLAPHQCLGCTSEGRLLCSPCVGRLRSALSGCYRCRAAAADFATCLTCRDLGGLSRVRAAVIYEKLAKDLVWRLKFAHAQSAAREMAALMHPLLLCKPRLETGTFSPAGHLLTHSADLLIVPVPTATTRARQRGYDQARLLAREVARSVRRPYTDVLARQGQAHQVGASREQRKQQLATAFRVTKPQHVAGARLLLIDDVVTTGATLEAAAAALRAVGARHIEALVFAQPKLQQRGALT